MIIYRLKKIYLKIYLKVKLNILPKIISIIIICKYNIYI